jgi:hypothetical protein
MSENPYFIGFLKPRSFSNSVAVKSYPQTGYVKEENPASKSARLLSRHPRDFIGVLGDTKLSKFRRLFWMTLGILTLARLLFVGRFELCPDEAYYWTWSRHLDWSYYDQGPMLALVIRFFTSLTGAATEFSVRLGAVVLSAISAWIFFKLVERIFKDSRIAWMAFLGLQAALLFSAGAILMMHDSIMICFWMAALYFFYRALHENWNWGWLGGALTLGLGGLSKYTMALFVPCLFLYLILSPEHRVWWKRPQLYLAGLATVLLVSPVFAWNHAHGWASFGHVGHLSGLQQKAGVSLKTFFDFLGGQLGVMTPLLAAFCTAALGWGWRQWQQRSSGGQASLFLFCFSAPILMFFMILSFRTSVYANWPAPAYPACLALLAAWWKAPLPKVWQRWAWATLWVAAVFTVAAHLEVGWNALPLSGRALESVDRIRGWREIGEQADRLLREMPGNEKPFLAAQRYQMAAILEFYTPGQPEVQLFPRDTPATNQYRFWDHAPELAGRNALYVCEDEWEINLIRPKFQSLEVLPVFSVIRDGRKIREVRFIYARGLRPENEKAYARSQWP